MEIPNSQLGISVIPTSQMYSSILDYPDYTDELMNSFVHAILPERIRLTKIGGVRNIMLTQAAWKRIRACINTSIFLSFIHSISTRSENK